MTRDEFREGVFERDGYKCVHCGAPAVDAHHLIERRLWDDGGYHLNNGVSVCSACHMAAEATTLSATQLRKDAGIERVLLPDILEGDHEYDKWGNIILPDGTRMRGPLFYDESVQKVIAPVLAEFNRYVKYPRTPHLPWSLGREEDDIVRDSPFSDNDEVIVTEKLDGENTTMYFDYLHARSLTNEYHWSRTWVKNFWSQSISYQIPQNMRIVGENMHATHSIKYTSLESFFYGISIWEDDTCLDWETTIENFDILGIVPVPVLAQGYYYDMIPFFEEWRDGDDYEGYVVRKAGPFKMADFQKSVAKYVRPNHVTNRTHWRIGKLDKNELC